MLSLLSNPRLTPACTNQLFMKTILAVWNWQITQINFAHALSTLGSNGTISAMPSKMKVLWLRSLIPACNLLILSQSPYHNLVLASCNICSWNGNVFFWFPVLLSLFHTMLSFFCMAVFFCICQTFQHSFTGSHAQRSPNPSPITMVKE